MKRSDFGTIIQIGDILVSEDVVVEYFSCDYQACKGRCCIIGDSGAPLDESELEPLERDYAAYSPLMSERGREAVQRKGFFEIDREGDIVTPLASGSEECAFTHFDGSGNCLCAIERSHCEGLCSFPKPLSCRLYPVRVKKFCNGMLALNLHRWDICSDAFKKGRRENVRVYQFLRGPLIDAFGEEFYSALSEAAKRLITVS